MKNIKIPGILSLLLGATLWLPVNANVGDKSLKFFHTHTGKYLEVTFFENGRYNDAALRQLNDYLGDFRTGESIEMDPRLFDILHLLQLNTGNQGIYQIISAYRSPETNEMLRAKSKGVAKKSQHLLGKAIDVRLPGIDTEKLRNTAIALKMGGVGYYRKSDFIHVDVGKVRNW